MNQNWFKDARDIDMISYLELHEGREFVGNPKSTSRKCLCPFHADTKPTFSVKLEKDGWIYKCFSCGVSGDLVKYVSELHNKSALDAVKEILVNSGVDIGTEDISEDEKKERQKAQALLKKEREDKQNALRVQREKEFKQVQKKLNIDAPKFSEALHAGIKENAEFVKEWSAIIPHFYNLDEGVVGQALGYDALHKSICFLIRDDSGNVYNIKHRSKYIYDQAQKRYTSERMDGKWLGAYNGKEYPFGYHFWDADPRVVICEGEKDVINLTSIGINAVTLGGTSASWDEWKKILSGRDVFVWFDNDMSGYKASFTVYESIKDICASTQMVMFFKIGTYHDKYDVSDFLVDDELKSRDEVFNRIIYSSFLPNNYLIDELIEYLQLDGELDESEEGKKKQRDLAHFEQYLDDIKSLEFADIEDTLLKSVKTVKGVHDKEIGEYERLFNVMMQSDNKRALKDIVISLIPADNEYLKKEARMLADIIGVKTKLLNKVRGNKVHDTFHELINAAKRVGFDFAKYRGGLYIYTGSHYSKLSNEYPQFLDFLFQKYFAACKLDFASQNIDNSKKVEENIIAYAPSLEPKIDPGIRVMNMSNGTLIIRKSGKVIFRTKYRKDDCALNTLPFAYDPSAKAPKWDAFLNRVLPNKIDQDALGEFMGYTILPSNRFEKYLILYGPTGANGKSVVLDTIADFFHKDNVSHLQLEKFEGHDLEVLPNKILNIGGEIQSSGDLRKQLSTLKLLTDNLSSISINPKHEKPFALDVNEKPKMAFATNDLPRSGADDGGVLRRMLLLHFSEEIKDKEKIRDLVNRMSDDKSGILNFALDGLKRLIRNGKFSQSTEMGQFMEEYKDDLNHVRAYANQCLTPHQNVIVPKKFIYAHYQKWAEENGIQKPYSNNVFFSKLKKEKNYTEKQKSRMEITATEYRDVAGNIIQRPVTLNAGRCLENIAIDASVLGEYEVDGNNIKSSAFHSLGGVEMIFESEKEEV